MSIKQELNSILEINLKEIEKHLDCSFDKINNFIDQIFILDFPIQKFNNQQQESQLPKVNEFKLIDQSQFQSQIIQELQPLINNQIKHQLQIQLQQNQDHQQQQQQQQLIQSQFNIKSFNYQIINHNSIKQKQEYCCAVAFNKVCSIVAAGCNNLIKIYEFKQGMLKQNQILNDHNNLVSTLNFMKKSNQFISGDNNGFIMIWQNNNNNNNNQWICSQTLKAHNDRINCLIMNNNEDTIISSSNDFTIKFWIKQNEWICQQTITDHKHQVYQLNINEQQNKVISCGRDQLILIIEYSEYNKKWMVIQNMKVDCQGYRLCFINDNLFTFQPKKGNLMHIYEMNSVSKQFIKTKNITVNQGDDGCAFFPQQYIKSKQLLVSKHNQNINLIRKLENDEFKVEQSIQFGSNCLFGQISDDGEYLITWDHSSKEIQIRKYTEE
ncbi:unnamed protein product [Paramecium primaurelia]|uniref:WD40-repeat-containing domain n=1 Tax=Paramecium primaurelia TaxID=5886 RepID=A0A8S1QRS7_PARPR|nr:unnamed protein product [Paramecium primaurelia]